MSLVVVIHTHTPHTHTHANTHTSLLGLSSSASLIQTELMRLSFLVENRGKREKVHVQTEILNVSFS